MPRKLNELPKQSVIEETDEFLMVKRVGTDAGKSYLLTKSKLRIPDPGPDLIGMTAMIPTPGGSGPTYLGWNNALVGTLTSRQPANTNLFTLMPRIGLVTAATAGSIIGMRHQALTFTRGDSPVKGGFRFKAICGTAGTVAGTRCFVGFTSNGGAPTNVNPSTLTHILGIGRDDADTNWQIMHNDGSGTASKIDTAVPANSNSTDPIEVEFYCAPGDLEVKYRFTNVTTGQVVTGSIATDLPGSATLLAVHAWITNNATAAAAALDVMGIFVKPYRKPAPFFEDPPPVTPYTPPAEPTYTTQNVYTMDQTGTVAGQQVQAHNASKVLGTHGYDSVRVFDSGKKSIFDVRGQDRASFDPSNKVRSEFFVIPRAQRGQLITLQYDFMIAAPANPAAVPHTRAWLIVGQVHQADPQNGATGSNLRNSIGSSPLYALEVVSQNGVEVLMIRGETDTANVQTTFPPQRNFGTKPFVRGKRYKFRAEIIDSNGRTAAEGYVDGVIRTWLDDMPWVNYVGRVGYWSSAPENAGGASVGSYVKYGIYSDDPTDAAVDPGLLCTYWDITSTIT